MSLTFRCGGGMIYNEDKKGADKMLQKILETTPYEQCTTPENFTKFKIVETNFNNISNRYERIPEEKVIIEGTDYPANIETTFKLFHNIIVRNTKGDLYELMYNTKEVTKETKIWTGEMVKSVHTCIEYQVYRRVRKKTIEEVGEINNNIMTLKDRFDVYRAPQKYPIKQVIIFILSFIALMPFLFFTYGIAQIIISGELNKANALSIIMSIVISLIGPTISYIYTINKYKRFSAKIILHHLIKVNTIWIGFIVLAIVISGI